MIITLDGPAGSGKSTLARKLAHKLGFSYLDTGALYRLVSHFALQKHIELSNGAALAQLASDLDIRFVPQQDAEQKVYARLDSNSEYEDLSLAIRRAEIDACVSEVSAAPELRAALLVIQRDLAGTSSIVAEGRDLGSVVFPEAEFKVYLYASVEARAQRRYLQNKARFEAGQLDMLESLEEIKAQIQARDDYDSNRKEAPLQVPQGALMYDSSNKSPEQCLDELCQLAQERMQYPDGDNNKAIAPHKEELEESQGDREAAKESSRQKGAKKSEQTKKQKHPHAWYHNHPCSEHPWYARLVFGILYVFIFIATKLWTGWTIEGLEELEVLDSSKGVVYVANHSHAFDPGFIQAARPRARRIRFIYKSEFDSMSLVSRLLAWVGSFPVKRHTADRTALKLGVKALEAGEDVGIFPEGTRIRGRAGRGKIHGGFAVIAHMAQAPVVPIALEGLWRLPKPGKVRIKIGKPLMMQNYEHLDRKERIAALEKDAMEQVYAMRDELDRRNKDYEASDCR